MYLVGFGLLVFIVWLIWTFARNVIVWAMFALDIAQFYVVKGFAMIGLGSFGRTANGYLEFMKGTFDGRVDPFEVEYAEMMTMSEMAGGIFRWVFAIFILAMAVHVLFKMKGGGFSRQFSLAGGFGPSLADFQSQHWKVFAPGAAFDPDNADEVEGPAATPMEWMKANNVRMSEEEDGLDFDAATRAFENQLGAPWQGVEKADTYVKVLCAAFYINAKRDKNARGFKEKIAVAYTTMKPEERDKLLESMFEKVNADPKFGKMMEKYASKHAYTNTALFRLLTWSRAHGGVFASAEFRWLKAVDRPLWYTLNNCGRRSYHIEGAGAVCHFNAENIVKGPLVDPHVDQAVDGLDDYLEGQGLMDLEAFFDSQQNDF
ncbi:hypothetical protein Salmuc_03377 [Salipiger mucosus DSM 16094]|uniref:DotM C-terminal cytoplasmic domain-containing protein n=2 Tax=Salipiger mucosus TaxID=263378 RepID=S9RIX1_9RHOB|nr:hypothetical protein Salmuc_03377 [Salipiger mucosus DSM 16094]